MIDTNVKNRIAGTLKSLRTDVELCEGGTFEGNMSDLLGTLRVNADVSFKQLAVVVAEVEDLLRRANVFLVTDRG